jgi:AcrR family transcriptional regulator
MSRATPSASKRPYRSTLRAKQAEDTRDLIIAAVGEELAAGGIDVLSVERVADRAGVSPRTVYRHFPTRESLLDSVGKWVVTRTRELPDPLTAEELPVAIVASFESFDRHETMMRGFLATAGGRQFRAHMRRKRLSRINAALDVALAGVDPARARSTKAIIGHLCSAATWQALKDEAGLTGTEAGQAVASAIEVLLRDTEPAPARTTPRAAPPTPIHRTNRGRA